MTLKERFEAEIMDLPIMSEVVDDIAKNLEYIAEDFAIGFTYWYEWCDYRAFKTLEELLEIYKKEKGL